MNGACAGTSHGGKSRTCGIGPTRRSTRRSPKPSWCEAGGQVVGRLGIEPRRVTQKSVQCDYFAVPDPGAVPKGALKPFDSVTVAVPYRSDPGGRRVFAR